MTPLISLPLFSSRRRLLMALIASSISLPLVAQDTPAPPTPPAPAPVDMGFFRIVNATGLPGKLRVRVDGREASRKGFDEGYASGAVGLAPKSYQVELEHETLGKASCTVPVQLDQISTVIAFKTDKPDKDPKVTKAAKGDPEKAGPRLVSYVMQLPRSLAENKAPALTLLQFTAAEEINFSVTGTSVAVPAGKPVKMPITRSMGTFPEIQLQDKTVCGLNMDMPTDYLVIFYGDKDGNLKKAVLRNDVW